MAGTRRSELVRTGGPSGLSTTTGPEGRGEEQPPKEQRSVLNLGRTDPEEAEENGTFQNLKKPWLAATGGYQNTAVATGRTEDRRADGNYKA